MHDHEVIYKTQLNYEAEFQKADEKFILAIIQLAIATTLLCSFITIYLITISYAIWQ